MKNSTPSEILSSKSDSLVKTVLYKDVLLTVKYDADRVWKTSTNEKFERWTIELCDFGSSDAVLASIISGPGTIGYEYNLYELAFLQKGQLMNTFEKDWGSLTIGNLDELAIFYWIEKMLDRLGIL